MNLQIELERVISARDHVRRLAGRRANPDPAIERRTARLAGLLVLGVVATVLSYSRSFADDSPAAPADEPANTAAADLPPEIVEQRVAADAATSTTLIGRIIYDGPPPEPKRLRIPLTITYWDGENWVETPELPERRRIYELSLKDESLLVGDDGGIANVVVWARSNAIPAPPRSGPLPPSTIRAKDARFQPHVLAFWNVTPMRWINDTDKATNFNWTPIRAASANRLLAQGQEIEFEVKLRRAEPFPVALTCNIHPWLRAYILPLSHPYFAVTGPDGRFEIKNLPLGEWEFAIWHERIGRLKTDRFPTGRFAWTIRKGENSLGDLRVDPKTLADKASSALPQEPAASGRPSIDELGE